MVPSLKKKVANNPKRWTCNCLGNYKALFKLFYHYLSDRRKIFLFPILKFTLKVGRLVILKVIQKSIPTPK